MKIHPSAFIIPYSKLLMEKYAGHTTGHALRKIKN